MELAEHQWLQKLYFLWDVTFHVNLLIYKLPTTKKKNSSAFGKSTFTQQISLFVSDRHIERRVGGISNLEAISGAKRYHIYLKFLTQAAVTMQSLSSKKIQDFIKGKANPTFLIKHTRHNFHNLLKCT